MINSRSIDDLTLDAQAWFKRFVAHAEAETGLKYGVDWKVISTYRDQEYQDYLWEQGRTRPGLIVTRTHHSKHTSRRAWDIGIMDGKQIIWESAKYKQLADVGRKMGLEVGWDFGDPPHYQTPEVMG